MTIRRREVIRGVAAALGAFAVPGMSNWVQAGQVDSRLFIDGLSGAFRIMSENPLDESVLAAIRASGLAAVNMTTPRPGDDFKAAVEKVSRLQQVVSEHSESLLMVRTESDIQRARSERRLGIIIGFQSTEMFDESLDGIGIFHDLGARIMQMSYNGPGLFGHGCLSESPEGLSERGFDAVSEMNRLGVLVDASHANKATTANTIAASQAPVVISHTGCNGVYRHPRNNDDTELRALAENGGVAGIYLMPFLEGGKGELTPEMLMKHISHALNICGEDHVGIGSDQGIKPVDDGPEYRHALRKEVERRVVAGISAPGESADRPPFIPALNVPGRMASIGDLMQLAGYPSRVVDKVLGTNFYRVMSEVW